MCNQYKGMVAQDMLLLWRAVASLLSFGACVLIAIFWKLLLLIVLLDAEAFHLVSEAESTSIPRKVKHVAGPSNFEGSKGILN